MTKQFNAALCLSISLAFAISGCKPKAPADPVQAPVASAPASVPEPAAAPAAVPSPTPAAASAAAVVDLDKIAVIAKPVPPFPFIDYPPAVDKQYYSTKESDFDQVHLILGDKVHAVEGRVRAIHFTLHKANISQFQAQRDYTKAVLDMGGIKVNTAKPHDSAFLAAHGDDQSELDKKLRYEFHTYSYEAYFLPTATGRKWIVLMVSDEAVDIISVEEKQTASSVKVVTASAMKSELDSKGHVALYINFDTDKAAIRPDGKPAVDEIAALMKKEAALRLSVEGHTDNVGDKARNVTLSRERAQAVVQALVSDGIDSARLSAAGHGAEKPVTDNGSEDGRAKNRRVELVKVAKG
ncbi:OmpA family protein [Massilia pseudoviolaceinigra]|uniref:OmpA family protein n=1 Tax=Massilia pseudoviolaceinigra TaxID=3057165 RepID=UPI002796A393|nr:OmpA family protein [Massilia sp. CCM 9206]MDQ1923893.1 OmpA family protein [Massilia sp. CCM 9206]